MLQFSFFGQKELKVSFNFKTFSFKLLSNIDRSFLEFGIPALERPPLNTSLLPYCEWTKKFFIFLQMPLSSENFLVHLMTFEGDTQTISNFQDKF